MDVGKKQRTQLVVARVHATRSDAAFVQGALRRSVAVSLVVPRKTTQGVRSPSGTPRERSPLIFPQFLGEVYPPFTVEDWEKGELAIYNVPIYQAFPGAAGQD